MTILTAADLAKLEARHTTTLDNGERVIDEDTAHLLTALREARALVEALAVDKPGDNDNEYGSCPWCGALMVDWGHAHDEDCAWQAAREAMAAWKGGGDGKA